MLETLFQNLGVEVSDVQERMQGAAFLRVAREAYPLSSVVYVALNVPIRTRKFGRFVHCAYGDAWARHGTSAEAANLEKMGLGTFFQDSGHGDSSPPAAGTPRSCDDLDQREISIALTAYHGEAAALIIKSDDAIDNWQQQRSTITQEFRALGQYFHQHMLRIFGLGNEKALIVSAREIDCLKWMAAGKTAWEVSTILGISERTVRFHLNAAREKLQSTTTTQAVAKAVSQQLFVL